MSKEKLITQFKGKTFSSNEQVIRWLEKARQLIKDYYKSN
jgi:hypothetical protein